MGNTLTSDTSNHFLTVEEARSRLTGEEYHRIHTAFNRFKKPALSFDDFCYHLLGNAPIPIEEQRTLFLFFTRGADSLSFEDLLCALVGLCQVEDVQKSFSKEHAQSNSWRPPLISPKMDDSFISFYEVMSYVTHLSVGEVMELEKVFATISDRTVCKMSKERWDESLGGCFPEYFSERLFCIFDENKDGHIDFRELVCGLSAMCRGPFPSRLSFLAKLWDEDNDNELLDHEVQEMYRSLNVLPEDQNLVKSGGNAAALVDFATWALVNEGYTREYYRMAVEVGHICLGLRPESYQLEHGVVGNFEERTRDLNLPVWNIVASTWHKDWKFSTEKNKKPPPVDNSYIKGSKEDDGWSGKVACISPESASLRSDLQRSEYVVVSPALWRAWLRWHGSAFSVDGQFTRKRLSESFFDDGKAGLELYPLDILLMGHDRKKNRDSEGIQPVSPWACAQVSRSMTVDELLTMCTTELRLREGEARLWLVVRNQDTNEEANTMLDDGQRTLYQLGLRNKKVNKFLLEVRDQSNGVWPEELRASLTGTQITSIASNNYSARPGAVGLVNSGNFCYRNAAIQCLARIVPLTDFLLDENNLDKLDNLKADILASLSLCNRKALSVTLEYAKLIQELWAGKKKNIVPNSFNDSVRNASDMFDSFEQHDCQEFVSFLLDQLQMSIQLLEKNEKSDNEIECKDDAPDQEKAEVSWNKYLERENSLVSRLLAGQLRSRLICRSCQNSSTVFEPYTSISLPIGFDNVELYQIIVAPRDGSIPKRFGFRLPRETSVGQFKTMVSYSSKIDVNSLTLQCVGSRGTLLYNGRGIDSSLLLREFPNNARLYALEIPDGTVSWRLGAHRKLQYNHEPYLLGSTGGCLVSRFGLPLIISCSDESTNKDLYDDVMQQIKRFMDLSSSAFTNRAMDPCEDASSGYPFSLCITDASWEWCGQCVSLNFCRGCKIAPDSQKVYVPENCTISVDWLPIALYLKYNHSQELACIDDASVDETWNQHVAPSSLGECLQKFSCPETLEELLHCDKCERKTQRDKVMSIWRMPKYLIVHLKRFEYLRNENRMGKCKRTIDFPLSNFDPSPYVDQKDGGLYDCIAIANHYGQLSSGHFVSYAIGKDKKWLLLNDCSVREVSELDVDKAAAYLLFYERKETTKEY